MARQEVYKEGQYTFFSDPLKMYISMLSDIEKAKHYVYLETYRFGRHAIGQKFRYILQKKHREGVEIKLLVDSWGSASHRNFFHELIKLGAGVRYFKKIKLTFDGLTKHHRRDHRKLLVIDNKITYIGSSNITDHCFNWRESNLRIYHDIALAFRRVFLQNFDLYNKRFYDKIAFTRVIDYDEFRIIRDVPSTLMQPTKKQYLELIKTAKNEIIIETPYFLPSGLIRKALNEAGKRGVKVKIIIPKRSDVGIIDVLRNKYLGQIHTENVHIYFYLPQNLHAKIFIADRKTFIIGSSNFDYRSFRFQYELNLMGENKTITNLIVKHVRETLSECESFDFDLWIKRSPVQKFFENLLVPFRHLF